MPGISAAPLSAAQIAARLRAADGEGSGIESDLVMARRPFGRSASLSPANMAIAAPAFSPDATRARAIFGA
jgi:hypothetical protein